ncbi:hypothetical protein LSAT2_025032 [Lamellibrachia satsuma]|nr:hypothetical protein LSAT2_025032 [Lamellibrachia satsuma]
MELNTTTTFNNGLAKNISREELNYEFVRYYCTTIIHPVIFTIGITGNVMNLVIFTRQRMRHGQNDIEKAATTGLMFLAVSDMMYCLAGLMAHVLVPLKCARIYYEAYKTALLNTFQFSSTWQTVAVAVERYVAVTHPFEARQIASASRTTVLCTVVFLVSVVFNIPFFFFNRVVFVSDGLYMRVQGPMRHGTTARHIYTIVWSVVGIVVPLMTLAFCNVRFLVAIYRSQARFTPNNAGSDSSRRKSVLSRTTVTFVLIICLFFVLVCPAMVLEFIGNFVRHLSDASYYRFQLTLVITNTMLLVNFSVNFLLYCYALRDFRKTLANMVGKADNDRNECRRAEERNISHEMDEIRHKTQLTMDELRKATMETGLDVTKCRTS